MLKKYLQQILAGAFLSQEEAEMAMQILLEQANPEQISAFLAILKYRGETLDEIVGMVRALEKKAVRIDLPFPVLDIVGTGGDLAGTVNISTGAAILAAACGVPVAKHGNRSATGRCGSADVLEAMGLEIEIPPDRVGQCLEEMNLAYLFAPYYHPSLKKISGIRKGLTFPTVFNMLGPLLNPAGAEYALIGVAKESNVELFAKVLLELGNIKRALVFHGSGLDELAPLGKSIAYEVSKSGIKRLDIDPGDLGFSPCTLGELQGGDSNTNAYLLTKALSGESSAIADSLVMNAGAALYIYGKAETIQQGVEIAKKNSKEGRALDVLDKWKNFSIKIRNESCMPII
jgi:anthranilate phosphoribosyltransferase